MMRPSRRRRMMRGNPHLSVSASDAEWEGVRASAARRGLPIARYLVELAQRDGGEAEPSMALAVEEQRELLEAVREIRSLVLEGADAAPLVRDMQERVAVRFRAWALATVRSGRSRRARHRTRRPTRPAPQRSPGKCVFPAGLLETC